MKRTVVFPPGTTFRADEGKGCNVYIATVPGAGETHIEVGWSAVEKFEECVVGRVGGVPTPEVRVGHEVAPSVAWVGELHRDDQEDFFQDVRRAAATYDLDALDRALSVFWVIAMGERAQDSAPGPDEPTAVDAEQVERLRAAVRRLGGSWTPARVRQVFQTSLVDVDTARDLMDVLVSEGVLATVKHGRKVHYLAPMPSVSDADSAGGGLS